MCIQLYKMCDDSGGETFQKNILFWPPNLNKFEIRRRHLGWNTRENTQQIIQNALYFSLRECKDSLMLLTDLRTKQNLQFFEDNFPITLTFRVSATDQVRKSVSWAHVPEVTVLSQTCFFSVFYIFTWCLFHLRLMMIRWSAIWTVKKIGTYIFISIN